MSWGEELPNAVAFRKVSETRYNLSINLLDQYAQQEIVLKIRRTTGEVSSIISTITVTPGKEGKAGIAIRRNLLPSDVFLFTSQNNLIYKIALRDATLYDLTDPNNPILISPESATPNPVTQERLDESVTISESNSAIVELPNNARLRTFAHGRNLLTFNLLDQYAQQEIVIERVRKIGTTMRRAEIGRVLLGEFGKASLIFSGKALDGDIYIFSQGGYEIYRYLVK